MKMKTPVEMMNVVVRKTRLARAVVLLGVGLLAGAVSIQAETLLFEKVFQVEKLINTTIRKDINDLIEIEQNDTVDIGTIRLETGEKLTLGEIKHLRLAPQGNHPKYEWWYESFPFFELELKYDFFSKEQKLKITNQNNKTWEERFTNDIISGSNVNWPIEGPVTISLKAKPFNIILRARDLNNIVFTVDDRVEQYLRITFEKSAASLNNNQTKQQVLVLPKGSGVNELVLESSEDLVNWEKDSLGDKNTDAANRFYRLRAVKK